MVDSSERKQLGYTLLEVLVAFVIAAFSMTVLLYALGQTARNAGISQEYATATTHAESLLAQLNSEQIISPGRQQGRLDANYVWERIIRPYRHTQYNDVITTPYEIIVTVRWKSGNRSRAIEMRSLRLGTNRVVTS